MLADFPFEKDTFGLVMGVKPIGPSETMFVVDRARYLDELALKRSNMERDARYRVQVVPGQDDVVWDAVEAVLARLADEHPEAFSFTTDGATGTFDNHLTGETTSIRYGDPSSLPAPPMQWLGMQVQEDLCLLDTTDPGFPLVAGCLCFPSMWSLDEKIGRSLLDIHVPVPFFHDKLGLSLMRLMDRLKEPVWRLNWGIYPTPRLDLEPPTLPEWEHLLTSIRPEDAGAHLYLRVERQTLSRLPKTRAILFTIHTYVGAIEEEARDARRLERMRNVLRTVPPESQRYKRLAPYLPALLAYLDARG